MKVPEIFLIKTEGGPHPGTFVADETQYTWPLPGILGAVGGKYVKVSESSAPPQEQDSRYKRGACYHWFTSEQLEEAKNAKAQD